MRQLVAATTTMWEHDFDFGLSLLLRALQLR